MSRKLEPYPAFVHRVWDRLTDRTGHAPFYLDARHIAAYCPACLDGTLTIGFVSHPKPRAFVSSRQREVIAWGEPADEFLATELARVLGEDDTARRCSRGCSEAEIVEALFG